MNPKLIICRGLPASGKSLFAKKEAVNQGVTRINRDDLRKMAHLSVWNPQNEKIVCTMRDAGIRAGLQAGHTVIVDDTNGSPGVVKQLTKIAAQFNAEVIIRWFPCSVEEAIARDARRADSVGADVIRKMADQYPHLISGEPQEALQAPYKQPNRFPDELPNLYPAIIVDIDGTLAWNKSGRSYYDNSNEAVKRDAANWMVCDYITIMAKAGYKILIFSGREDSCYEGTTEWLKMVLGPFTEYELHMRKAGDQRKDAIIKREMYDAWVKNRYGVHVVLDDRDQCVKLWRELGLQCWQVADGAF